MVIMTCLKVGYKNLVLSSLSTAEGAVDGGCGRDKKIGLWGKREKNGEQR